MLSLAEAQALRRVMTAGLGVASRKGAGGGCGDGAVRTAVRTADSKSAVDALLAATPASQLVVIDQHTSWCGPCKQIAPRFAALAAEFPRVVFAKVDGDEYTLPGVSGFPTFQFYKGGKLVHSFSGADAAQLRRGILEHSTAPEAPAAVDASEKEEGGAHDATSAEASAQQAPASPLPRVELMLQTLGGLPLTDPSAFPRYAIRRSAGTALQVSARLAKHCPSHLARYVLRTVRLPPVTTASARLSRSFLFVCFPCSFVASLVKFFLLCVLRRRLRLLLFRFPSTSAPAF